MRLLISFILELLYYYYFLYLPNYFRKNEFISLFKIKVTHYQHLKIYREAPGQFVFHSFDMRDQNNYTVAYKFMKVNLLNNKKKNWNK